MIHEWEKIDLDDYENHMSDPSVFQLQKLNVITQKQIHDYCPSSLVFLGVAGGNGLEHCKNIKKVYAIDVNPKYLDACSKRFPDENIQYIQMDLNRDEFNLKNIDLVIANLVFEYLHEEIVVPKISKILKKGGILSIVFQVNRKNSFVSKTQYSEKFMCLERICHIVDANCLDHVLSLNQFTKIVDESYSLPNGKALRRFDFMLR